MPESPETNGTARRAAPTSGGTPPAAAVLTDDAHTGLPGLRTWRAVYFAVVGIFALWVALLAALTFLFPAS